MNNTQEWKLISQDAEKRANKPTKKAMNDANLDEAKCIITYKRDKKRNIVNVSTDIYGVNGSETEKKKITAAKPIKAKTHSKHSFKELNMDEKKANDVMSTFEEYGSNYGDNKIGLYRFAFKKHFVEPGLMPNLTLSNDDGSAPIARGFLSMLKGEKYPDVAKKYVMYVGTTIENQPDDEGWIGYDYRRGMISNIDKAYEPGPNGGKSPIYKYDCPGNPWPENNVNTQYLNDLSEDEKNLILKYRNYKQIGNLL